MSTTFIYALLSVLAVSAISLIGVISVFWKSKAGKSALLLLVSFSAGALLGDVFVHLLPELAEEGLFNLTTTFYILAAIVLFLILEKFIHWHHHHGESAEDHKTHPFVFLNLVGDGIHNFIDGLIIGGAYLLDVNLGIATTIAVLLHEIPQEIGDFGILIYGGFSKLQALGYNFLSAAVALLGVFVAYLIGTTLELQAILVAIASGSFIYIAAADLIPEIHKENTRLKSHLISFILGIGVMYLLLLLE